MDIDPRLRGTANSSSYGKQLPPPLSFTPTPIRLPPPHPQRPLPSSDLPPLNHDGSQVHPYYALSQDPQSHPLSETHQQETGVDIQTGEESPNDPKRPRACEACRGLKVRCEPGTSNPEGACRRCAKAGRQCVITLPSRKRQKKTDSRVAELEKKIDALHASIQATKHSTIIEPQRRWEGNSHGGDELPHTTPDKGSSLSSSSQALQHDSVRANDRRGQTEAQYPIVQSQSQEIASHGLTVPSAIAAGRKRRHSEDNQDLAGNLLAPASMSGPTTKSANDRTKSYPSNIHDFLIPNETRASKRPSVVSAGSSSSQLNLPAHEYADIIDRKILDAGTATQIFDHYIRDMAFHLPAVVFPQGTTAAEIRRTKPTLFLAILSVSSGLSHPEIQRVLTKELTRVYADRIIIKGEKTLELIQALQISALWYWPPEHYEELKFYQLIHIGVVMAIDVGLGKRSKPSTHGNLGLWRDHPWKKTPFPNPNSVESRRAWLGCYFLCANVSMALRRPNLIRWTSFMDECIDVLETSPDACASDKSLCQWAKIQHIAEDIGIQFSMDDPSAQVWMSDPKVQYALKGFERQLEDWRKQLPTEFRTPSLKLAEHVVNLYMHEVATHADHNLEDSRPNTQAEGLRETGQAELLTPAHISALTTCLTSIHGIFDTFLALPTETVRNLPVFHFVRVAYACVLLIRMYYAATTADAEFGKVISKEDLRVEYYLDNLLEVFRAAAEHEKSRPAQKFLMLIVMLKTWFQRQRDGKCRVLKDAFCAKVGQHLGGNLSLGSFHMDVRPTETTREKTTPRLGYQQSHPNEDTNGHTPRKAAGEQNIHRELSGNTPLHLLSEVAMGNSAATPGGPGTSTGEWWYGHSSTNSGTASVGIHNPSAPPSETVMAGENDINLDAAISDGFEQAMSMTLGEGDLSSLFLGDGFFDLNLDGTPNGFQSLG